MTGNLSWSATYLRMIREGKSPVDVATSMLTEAARAAPRLHDNTLSLEETEEVVVDLLRAADAVHGLVVHMAIQLLRAGYSRTTVADTLDSSPNQVSRWERRLGAACDNEEVPPARMTKRERERYAEAERAKREESSLIGMPSGVPFSWQLPI